MLNGKVIIISAPSGAGKSTIVSFLIKEFKNLSFSVSVTTRKIRKDSLFIAIKGFNVDGHNFRCWVRPEYDPLAKEKYMSDTNDELTGWIYDATYNPDKPNPSPSAGGGGIMEEATENCSIS